MKKIWILKRIDMHYKGVDYKIRTLIVEDDYREPREIKLAPISLYEAMKKEGHFPDNSVEEIIDNRIYFYLDDALIDASAEEICESHLDIKFTLIDEI